METEALAGKVTSEQERWSGEEERCARRATNILPPKRGTAPAVSGTGTGAVPDEATDDPPCVKEAPVSLAGPWRKIHHCNGWWVAGHHMLHPCGREREAERLCERLREEWDET